MAVLTGDTIGNLAVSLFFSQVGDESLDLATAGVWVVLAQALCPGTTLALQPLERSVTTTELGGS